MSADAVWWEQTLAGRRLRGGIHQALSRKRSVWLSPDRLPWADTLRASVRDALYDIDSDISFISADAEYQTKPCEMLAAEWMGESVVTPSAAVRTLQNLTGVLWVYHIEEKMCAAWRALSCKLGGLGGALSLVLETVGDGVAHRGVTAISMEKYLAPFDLQFFAMLLLVNRDIDSRLMSYASSLCACLADGCVERCARFAEEMDAIMNDPFAFAQEAGIESATAQQAILRAQMSALWPLLEEQRLSLIQRLGERAEQLLPTHDNYGQEISKADMLELRHLHYEYRQGNLRLNRNEANQIQRLLDTRNEMAHLHILPYAWVEELLG